MKVNEAQPTDPTSIVNPSDVTVKALNRWIASDVPLESGPGLSDSGSKAGASLGRHHLH